MKVLIVNKFLYPNGGSETYIFKLGKALNEAGHNVQYFGMEHEGRCVGNRVEAYTSDMDFHGGNFLSKITYPFKTIYSTEARKKIRLVLDDFDPDVVHLNNFNYQLTPSIIQEIVKWREDNSKVCSIIFTAHDYQLLCPNHMFNIPSTGANCTKCINGKFYNCIKNKCIHGSAAKSAIGAMEAYFWKNKGIYRYLDKIVCCSEFMKDKMDNNPIFAGKTVAMHNFVDRISSSETEDESLCLSDGTNLPDRYVLYFGRYSTEKGIKTLIKACDKLGEVNFVFAGKGEFAEEIRNIHNAAEVGFRTGADLNKLIKGAYCTVYPSEWYENNPFSVMESQEQLVPVIGANIGGIPELIRDGVDGRVFTSGDSEELTEIIRDLWTHSEIIKKFRENLKNIRSKRMDVDGYTRWIVDEIYNG